jgi:hypothetical protein
MMVRALGESPDSGFLDNFSFMRDTLGTITGSTVPPYSMTYTIRVARGLGDLPYPVNLVLPRPDPWNQETEPRKPGHFYIEDVAPKTNDHHMLLGRFIDHWGQLEICLRFLLQKLAKTDIKATDAIISTMGIKQIIDVINSLATMRLSDTGIDLVAGLMELVSKLNSKRNVLIHGHWCLELFIWPYKNEVKMRAHLLREIEPPDYRITKIIFDVKHQKERIKYTFTPKRIIGAIKDTLTLFTDIANFNSSFDKYVLPDNST